MYEYIYCGDFGLRSDKMYPINIIEYKPKARRLKVVHPVHDFSDDEIPFEFEIFCRNTLMGITKNRVLDFEEILQDFYENEKKLLALEVEYKNPETTSSRKSAIKHEVKTNNPTDGQILMTIMNGNPLLSKGEPSKYEDSCWHVLEVHRSNKSDWRATPVIWKKEEMMESGFWSEESTKEPIKVVFEYA